METIASLKTDGRIAWMDRAKLVAIIAVVVDHCNSIMYTNKFISTASYFSVTTFILLSGMSTFYSYNRKPVPLSFLANAKKQLPLIKSYAIAVFILSIFYYKFFDLSTYISSFLSFNIQGPYYFILFFLQLKLITPFLLQFFFLCDSKERAPLWHLITLFSLLAMSSVFINYTFILPVHGGGRFLFGGTYLFVYYLGILLAKSGILMRINKVACSLCLIPIIIFWIWGMAQNKLPMDTILSPYFGGGGGNPPSFNLIVYSILIVFFLFSVFELIDNIKSKIVVKIFLFVGFLGKNTLYIFMYHLLIRDVILITIPSLSTNICFLRLVVFPCMVIAAPIIKLCVAKLFAKFNIISCAK